MGSNPYKIVEMHKNYRRNVPVEYHSDVMYVEPREKVWLKVKAEKIERSEFRANLKAKGMQGRSKLKVWHSAMVSLRFRRVGFLAGEAFPTLIIFSKRYTRPTTPNPHHSNAPGKLLRALNNVRGSSAIDKQCRGILRDLHNVTFMLISRRHHQMMLLFMLIRPMI